MHSDSIKTHMRTYRIFLFACILLLNIGVSDAAENPAPLHNNTQSGPAIFSSIDAAAANNKGMFFLEQENNLKAEEFFRLVIVLNPVFPAGYNNLAASLMRQKRYAESSPYLEKAIELDPHYVKAFSNLAIVLFHCGEYRAAYSWYCRAKKEDAQYVKCRFDRKKTINALDKMQKENPSRTEYSRMTEYLEKNPDELN